MFQDGYDPRLDLDNYDAESSALYVARLEQLQRDKDKKSKHKSKKSSKKRKKHKSGESSSFRGAMAYKSEAPIHLPSSAAMPSGTDLSQHTIVDDTVRLSELPYKSTPAADAESAAMPASPDDPASPDYVRVKLSRLGFVSVFIGLVLSIFLFAIDQTIVSTAIPAIAKEFQSLDKISWIGTAFLLTSSAFSPLYGKFADIFGRKTTFMVAIIIFEIGSLMCGAANSMELLILGRAVAGVGGAGIFSAGLIIISDIVSFRDRGKYQGILGAVFGVASVVGPLLGGAFTDSISWRWCFYINLPLGAVALVAGFFFLHIPHEGGSIVSKLKRIDYLGTFFVLCATICLLISLEFGGKNWAWSDWRTITMLVVAVILYTIFAVVEAKFAVEPLIPPSMFENRSVYALLAIPIFLGASFTSFIYYLPTYFQTVRGYTATSAGLALIPFMAGVFGLTIITGLLISRTGYITPFFFVGHIVLTVGAALMSTLSENSTRGQQIGYMIIAGCGIGLMVQTRILGIQAAVTHANIASATSSSNFFQTLGGVLGIAIVGTTFNNVLAAELGPELSALVSHNPTGVGSLPDAERAKPLAGFSKAFDTAYKVVIPLAALIFVLALLVKQSRTPQQQKQKSVEPAVVMAE
nr:hypothetical protein HK105_007946 [Polyrhizophydium stewartii]